MTARLALLSRILQSLALLALLLVLDGAWLIVPGAALALQLGLGAGRRAAIELFVALLSMVAGPFAAGGRWPDNGLVLLLLLPGLPWALGALQRAAATGAAQSVPRPAVALARNRAASPMLVALTLALAFQAAVGMIAGHAVLFWSGVLLLAGLGILTGTVLARIPGRFLEVDPPAVRLLAGERVALRCALRSRARVSLHLWLAPEAGWATLTPASRVVPASGTLEVRISGAPPLAGPAVLHGAATALDPWGMTLTSGPVILASLRVIPRAAYAAWLARRYLEGASADALPAMSTEGAAGSGRRRGLDYYGAKPYEPGDGLRDVLWKHALKVRDRLVVKERREGHGEAVILAMNLDTASPDEMDRLAYTFLTWTLTLAREGLPLAFAAYLTEGSADASPGLSGAGAVRHALGLLERLRVISRPARLLEASPLSRLERTIRRLLAAGTEPAVRLARLLALEHAGLLEQTRRHPAVGALRMAAARIPPPAGVLLFSGDPWDRAIVSTAVERLGVARLRLLPAPAMDGSLLLAPARRASSAVGA